MPDSNPFAQLPQLQPTPYAPQGTFRSTVLGYPTQADVQGSTRGQVVRLLSEQLKAGKTPQAALLDLFSTDAGQQALIDNPEIFSDVQNLFKEASGQGDIKVGSSERIVRPNAQGGYNEVLPPVRSAETDTRTATQKNVDALIEAEKTGDKAKADYLRQSMFRDSDGNVPFEGAVKLRAAGVPGTFNSNLPEDKLSAAQAQEVLRVSQAPRTNEVSSTDLLLRLNNQKTQNEWANENVTPEVAKTVLESRQQYFGSENLLKALLGFATDKTGTPGEPPAPPMAGTSPNAPGEGPQIQGGAAPVSTDQINQMSVEELDQLITDAQSGKKKLTADQIDTAIGRLRALREGQ